MKRDSNTKLLFFYPKKELNNNCIIVGSSSVLLNSENGNKIDQYKEVVRFNRAPVKNYEKYIGSKTTFRIINNHVFFNYNGFEKDNLEEAFFAKNLKYNNIGVISPRYILKKDRIKNMYNNNYFFFQPSFFQKLIVFKFYEYDFFWKLLLLSFKKNFSVGFCFILIVIASRLRPTLTGFDLNEDMKNRSHYWSNQNHPIGGYHDLDEEHKFIKLFKKNNLIDFLNNY